MGLSKWWLMIYELLLVWTKFLVTADGTVLSSESDGLEVFVWVFFSPRFELSHTCLG